MEEMPQKIYLYFGIVVAVISFISSMHIKESTENLLKGIIAGLAIAVVLYAGLMFNDWWSILAVFFVCVVGVSVGSTTWMWFFEKDSKKYWEWRNNNKGGP